MPLCQQNPFPFDIFIGQSPTMLGVKKLLKKVIESPLSTVLLYGESGTGKDLVAKLIHYNGSRKDQPFMNITCSALPGTLLESELFGHERGAFTDAKQKKKGLLELADGGTVFLDELSEMPPTVQAKLLRFLEEKTFKRVGGVVDIRVDVRVIAATNRQLETTVQQGFLRKDLFYRLTVLPIRLPPLREREGDIPLLARYFIQRFNKEFQKQIVGITPEGLTFLESHTWEGNVREFKNVLERAMVFAEGEQLTIQNLSMLAANPSPGSYPYRLPSGGINLHQLEQSLIAQALERTGGNRTRAAQLLGMTRDQIRYRIAKYGLQ